MSSWKGQAWLGFVLATAAGCVCSFSLGFVRFARPGARLFGPNDQYVDLANTIGAWISGAGMTVLGGLFFLCGLLVFAGGHGERTGPGLWGLSLGAVYVLAFSLTVKIAELIAGFDTGGPGTGELRAHLLVGASYPVVAAWMMCRWSRLAIGGTA